MTRREIFRFSFVKSLPILCSYLFVSMAYGILMEEAGFDWYWSLFVSLTVYTGAFQFALTTLLSAGASILTIAASAFFMNSRQIFYGLGFVEDFSKMGKLRPYMIHTMTDETYAVNCSLALPGGEKRRVMAWVAFLSRCYWMIGAVLGGIFGQLFPFSLEGIDFCMTALFVVILIGQLEKAEARIPALMGAAVGAICLLLFGAERFMLPALLLTSGALLLYNRREGGRRTGGEEQ